MTRETAIKGLKAFRKEFSGYEPNEEMFDMAIQALEQEPTTKNDLGVDREQLKTMIRGLTKWYVKRDNTEVGEPNTAVGLLYDDVMFGIDRLPSATPQEQKIGHWTTVLHEEILFCSECHQRLVDEQTYIPLHYCPNCGCRMVEPQESEDV